MKVFLTNLYLYNYEGKAETDEDDDAEFHFKIANKGLDDDKEEDSEVVEQTVKRKRKKGQIQQGWMQKAATAANAALRNGSH